MFFTSEAIWQRQRERERERERERQAGSEWMNEWTIKIKKVHRDLYNAHKELIGAFSVQVLPTRQWV